MILGSLAVTECPVRSMTPDVMEAIDWFEATHEVRFDQGVPHWQRVRLPEGGAIGDQNARQMATQDTLLAVHRQLLAATVKRAMDRAKAKAESERRRRG